MADGRGGAPVRAVIIAATPAVAAGLAVLLEREGVRASPYTGPGFSDSVCAPDAEVLVVDLTPARPGLPGLDDHPEAPVVFLADVAPSAAERSDSDRPTAWLRRDATGDELAAAVRAVAAGLDVYDPALRDADAGASWSSPGDIGSVEPLTPREVQVLRQLAGGLTNKAIAYDLGISEHTVKYHVGSILTKLAAASRAEAVAIAARRGLIAL